MPLDTLAQQDFHIPRGDYYEQPFVVTDEDVANPSSLAGMTVIFEVAEFDFMTPDPNTVFLTKSSANGAAEVEITDAANRKYTVKIDGADTAALEPGIYYHQSTVVDGSGNVTTVSRGRLWIDQTV